jgi:phosphoribosylamine-glycine ligase
MTQPPAGAKDTMINAAVIGRDGRTTAIRRALAPGGEVAVLSDGRNFADPKVFQAVVEAAQRRTPEFVFIGPEEPLAHGIVDALEKLGIRCIGPTRSLARLESSKSFTRELVARHHIPGNPEHRVFTTAAGIESYLRSLRDFVVKPDGLTGGKGVKVSGSHLGSVEEGVEYCRELLTTHPAVVVEEKLDGEEFSLQSFCDGSHVRHMPVVQDHKRAWNDDQGPNTGAWARTPVPIIDFPS